MGCSWTTSGRLVPLSFLGGAYTNLQPYLSPLTGLPRLQLILVASDLGQPVPYETMQPLQVALEDIDDNEPLFVRPPVSSPIPYASDTPTGSYHL